MYYDKENIRSDELKKDEMFLSEAQDHLLKRTGEYYDNADDIYNAWVELNRVASINEISAIKDYNYVSSKDRTQEEKEQMGRLYLAYDRLDDATSIKQKIGDYAEGILSAPSTYLGLISGGITKAAGVGGTRAAVQMAKTMATSSLKSKLSQGIVAGTKTAAVEGGIELGAETTRQLSRVEADAQEEVSGSQIALSTVAAAAPAGVLSGVFAGGVRGAQKEGVQELLQKSASAKATREVEANKITKAMLKKNKKLYNIIRKSSSTLDELDQLRVARGKEKLDELGIDAGNATGGVKGVDSNDILSDFDLRLKTDRLDRIAAATVELITEVGLDPKAIEGKRITDILAAALETPTGKKDSAGNPILGEAVYKDLLKTYELDFNDVAAMFAFEFSEAGRVLAIASSAKRNLKEFFDQIVRMSTKEPGQKTAEITARNKQVDKANKTHNELWQGITNVDSARRGLMTIQPATTVRNTANATFRTAMHAFENMGQGIIQTSIGVVKSDSELIKAGVNSLFSPLSLVKYLAGNVDEGRAIQALFAEASPEAAQRLFRSMADVSLKATDEEIVNQKGITAGLLNATRYLNSINTLSDNTFKRAMFASELAKEVGGMRALNKIIVEGRFASDITGEQFENATQRALELTYQKSFEKGTLASGFIKVFSAPGPSLIIPFPRYIANSLEFTYEHAPLIGMFDLKPVFGATGRTKSKRIAQQLTGAGMLFGAVQLRASMGTDTKWYELKDGKGNLYDAKALYGPFASYMVVADAIFRANELAETAKQRLGEDPEKTAIFIKQASDEMGREFQASKMGRELFKAAFGTQIKGVPQITSRIIDEYLQTGDFDIAGKLIADVAGNFFNSFTVGAGLAKDIMGTFDESYLVVPDTQDVNILQRFIKRSLRSIPQAPIDGDKLARPTRLGDVVRGSVPIIKQVTGLTPIAARNTIETELVKLNIEPYEFFKVRASDPRLRKAITQMYGEISEDLLIPFIRSKTYNRTKEGMPTSISEKKFNLNSVFKSAKTINGVPYTDEEYLLQWIQNGNAPNKDELIDKLYEEKRDRITKRLLNAVRSSYNSENRYRKRFGDLSYKDQIDLANKYAKERKITNIFRQ
jgi:hypothetical protein